MLVKVVYVGMGGFLGAAARYLISNWVQRVASGGFPYGTMAVNVLGSFAFGLFAVWMIEKGIATLEARLLVLTGALASFTTFSTFSYESLRLLQDASYGAFLGSVVGHLLLCLGGTLLGMTVGSLRL